MSFAVTTKNRAENLQLEVARLKDQLKEANSRIEESTATAAGLSSELESTKAKTAALSDQLQAAATKHETLQKANADLTNTISDLRHQLQLMEMDKKGALKEMEFSRREVEAAVRQRDNETKGLERQIQALEKEIEILRRAAANGQERSKTSPSDFIAAERDTLLAEVTRLRNVVAQGPAETTKLDAVAKAAQEEFERINAARKSDKERWKSEKNELLRRLEGLEGELKNRQIAAVPAPKVRRPQNFLFCN